jgi:hypothetical protein
MISIIIALLFCAPGVGQADHKDVALFASPVLVDIGFLAFVLPRFSLKTGVKVHSEPLPVGTGASTRTDVVLHVSQSDGRLVMRSKVQGFTVQQIVQDNAAATRFTGWLLSEIGQRTIEQFKDNGVQVFTGAANEAPKKVAVALTGDAVRGEGLSYDNCGRCHVIGDKNRMKGIGSTPSFAVLRSFDNWRDRFMAFYTLNPHPSFSQIVNVTAPFDMSRPPPISPLRLTLEELDDIVAFANTIKPADLGAPLIHQ